MNYLAIIFIISAIYSILNQNHLAKKTEDKLKDYKYLNKLKRSWILSDIMYYISQGIYPIWVGIGIFFYKWDTFTGCLFMSLIVLSFIFSFIKPGFFTNLVYSIIKILILFLILFCNI